MSDLNHIRALAEEAKRERERAQEPLTGTCPACEGTTRYPHKTSRRGTCAMCEDSEIDELPAGRIRRPRSWWMSVLGREP